MPRTKAVLMVREVLEAALDGLGLQKARIDAQIAEVQRLMGRRRGRPPGRSPDAAAPRKRGGISAAGRRRIALAQRKRWAALKKSAAEKPAPKAVKKRKISAAGRARIAAAQRKRWAKVKKAAPAAKKAAAKKATAASTTESTKA